VTSALAMQGAAACQLMSSFFLVTVMKSGPKKTLVTPSMRNKALASGETKAARALGKSKVPLSYTSRPGLNLMLPLKKKGKTSFGVRWTERCGKGLTYVYLVYHVPE
jgi:hypothetical protein